MDLKEIDTELNKIFHDEGSWEFRAYRDSGHFRHDEIVEKVQALAKEKLGDGLYSSGGATIINSGNHKFTFEDK